MIIRKMLLSVLMISSLCSLSGCDYIVKVSSIDELARQQELQKSKIDTLEKEQERYKSEIETLKKTTRYHNK